MLMVGEADFRPVTLPLWDPAARIEDLDKAGIQQQVISQTPLLFQWHRDPETAAAVARDFNDAAIEMIRDPGAQGRLLALCQVPLQSIDKACDEVTRAKKCGHVGVQIGNHVGPKDLDDDEIVAFLRHCAEEDFPVLVHPWDMSSIGPGNRTGDYMMGWTVGMPMETHLSISRMILGGAFDRLPESLRICFAHGGGAFPALLGRLDNAWRERVIARGKGLRPPKEYIGRFYVDSAVFDHNVLRLLVETIGENRVVYGSDYPFPLGEQKMCDLVRSAPTLTDRQRDAILFGNAFEFLGLQEKPSARIEAHGRPLYVQSMPSSAVLPHRMPSSSTWFDSDLQGPRFSGRRTLHTSEAVREGHRVSSFIAGKATWAGGPGIELVCPATSKVRGYVHESSADDVDAAVAAAKEAMAPGSRWHSMSLEARCAAVSALASAVEKHAEAFAAAESSDTGKPLALARGLDIPRSIANLRFFASFAPHASSELREVSGGPMDSISYSRRKPVGVVAVITPWNLPLYLLTWKLAPALVMGNSIVAKPSEHTPTTALMLAELCHSAGIPDGVFNVVQGRGAITGAALVSHPEVAAVSFTGGTATGAMVAAAAAPQFKKLSLELGGKNACVVFDDCSFEETVAGVLRSTFLNSGQICLCSSRIFVQKRPGNESFHDRYVAALSAAACNLRVGLPQNEDTDLGPVISAGHLAKIESAVATAISEGGTVLCGASRPKSTGSGCFYLPTLIAGLEPNSRTATEEIFGPVATLHEFSHDAEVPKLVNDSRYGLSASIWTESLKRAELADQLNVGTVWVNTWLNRELHMPFGGMKESGVNREGGVHSLDFYSESTTICTKRSSRKPLPFPGAMGLKPPSRGMCTLVPKPLGSYAYWRKTADLIFVSGIGPRDPQSDEVPGGPVTGLDGEKRNYDCRAQARQCFANLRAILASAGSGLEDVVDIQVFLIDMKRDFAAVNAVWSEEMQGINATRTTIGVTDLPPGGRIAVEIKAVAKLRGCSSAQ